MKTYILCAGKNKRWVENNPKWGHLPKHFAEINGVGVLERTLTLLNKKLLPESITIVVNTNNDNTAYKVLADTYSVNLLAVQAPDYKSDFKKLGQIIPEIEKETENVLVLMGDTYWRQDTLEKTLKLAGASEKFLAIGRYKIGSSEIFGLILTKNELKQLRNLENKVKDIEKPGGWLTYRYFQGYNPDYDLKYGFGEKAHKVGDRFRNIITYKWDKDTLTNDFDTIKDYNEILGKESIAGASQKALEIEQNNPNVIKILFAREQWLPNKFSGSQTYDHALAKVLQKAGFIVKAYAIKDKKTWCYDDILVNHNLSTYRPDIIITNSTTPFIGRAGARVTRTVNIANIVGITHNDSLKALQNTNTENSFASIICNSEATGQKITKNKATLIPQLPEKVMQNKDYIEKKEKIIAININQTKGGGIIKAIIESELSKNLEFTVVKGQWGKQEQIKESENVKIIEKLNDLTTLISEHTILLLPSIRESWSITATEAIAQGLTVITYDDLMGVKENLGMSGFFLPRSATTEQWIEKIEEVIAINQTIRAKESLKQARKLQKVRKKQEKDIISFIKALKKDK